MHSTAPGKQTEACIGEIALSLIQKRKQYSSLLGEDIVISDSVDTDLHSLRLECLKLKTIDSAAFTPGAFLRLVDLSLANNSIEDFTPLGALRMLKRLDISCNKIDGRLFAGYREVHHGKTNAIGLLYMNVSTSIR